MLKNEDVGVDIFEKSTILRTFSGQAPSKNNRVFRIENIVVIIGLTYFHENKDNVPIERSNRQIRTDKWKINEYTFRIRKTLTPK